MNGMQNHEWHEFLPQYHCDQHFQPTNMMMNWTLLQLHKGTRIQEMEIAQLSNHNLQFHVLFRYLDHFDHE